MRMPMMMQIMYLAEMIITIQTRVTLMINIIITTEK